MLRFKLLRIICIVIVQGCIAASCIAGTNEDKRFLVYGEIRKPGFSLRRKIIDNEFLLQIQKAEKLKDVSIQELLSNRSKDETKLLYNNRDYIESAQYFQHVYQQLKNQNDSIALTEDKNKADLRVYIKNYGFYYPTDPIVYSGDFEDIYIYQDYFNTEIAYNRTIKFM